MEGRCVRPQPNPVLSSLGGQDGKNSPLQMRIDDDEEGSRFGMTVIKYYNYGGNKLTFSSESLCVLLHKQKQTTAKDSQQASSGSPSERCELRIDIRGGIA